MTKGPGALVYMPPEAIAPSSSKPKYDASIDVFSFGVVTIFTIGEVFPCDPEAPTYTDETSGLLVARTELQRLSVYMREVNAYLRACGQLRGDHPLIRLIQQCLHNLPAKRPGIFMHLLEEAIAGIRDEEWVHVQTLQIKLRNHAVRVPIPLLVVLFSPFCFQRMEQDLQSRVQAVQQQLHSRNKVCSCSL